MKIGVAGEYKLIRRKADTLEVVQETNAFSNIITDIGLERFAGFSEFSRCYVGTGTATATALDTSMQSLVAVTQSLLSKTSSTSTVSPYESTCVTSYRFAKGTAAGNLAEVGVGWNDTSVNGIFSRARIVDAEGDPIVLTVLSDEVLDVVYVVKYYPPLDTETYTMDIGDTTYTIESKAALVTQNILHLNGTRIAVAEMQLFTNVTGLGGVTQDISLGTGAQSAAKTATVNSYVANSRQRTGSVTFNEDQANFAAINGFKLFTTAGVNSGTVHMTVKGTISPPIAKNNTETLTLNTVISWDRYTP